MKCHLEVHIEHVDLIIGQVRYAVSGYGDALPVNGMILLYDDWKWWHWRKKLRWAIPISRVKCIDSKE